MQQSNVLGRAQKFIQTLCLAKLLAAETELQYGLKHFKMFHDHNNKMLKAKHNLYLLLFQKLVHGR